MSKFKTNIFETLLAILTLISMGGLCLYFYELKNPTQGNPFKSFDNNPGIITIFIASFVVQTIFVISFLLLTIDKFKQNKNILAIYILAAITIGFLQWYVLYYGSTFYYGEVRDKQGLMFPVFASFMATLVIWKLNYSKTKNHNLIIKLISTGLINIGLYFLWVQVYEPWNLWQS